MLVEKSFTTTNSSRYGSPQFLISHGHWRCNSAIVIVGVQFSYTDGCKHTVCWYTRGTPFASPGAHGSCSSSRRAAARTSDAGGGEQDSFAWHGTRSYGRRRY